MTWIAGCYYSAEFQAMVLCNYVSLGYLPCSFCLFEFRQRLYSISREPRSSYLFASLCLILLSLLLQALRFPHLRLLLLILLWFRLCVTVWMCCIYVTNIMSSIRQLFLLFAARVKMKIIYQIIDWSFACSSLREVDKHLPPQCFPGSQTWLMEGCDAGPFESFQTRNSPRINLQTRHVNWLAPVSCCLLCAVFCVSNS